MNTPVISAFYFGSVEHYALLARHPRVIIDTGEHYERQSYRTRTSIIGPNGVQSLNVPIARDHGNKMPMHSVGLSYVETWPQQHLHAIRSAYGQTPWFIHYMDDVESVLSRRHARLTDLLLATMRLGIRWLGMGTELVVSERYVGTTGEWSMVNGREHPVGNGSSPVHHSPTPIHLLDLRSSFHPKKPLPAEVHPTAPYPQVFADRHGFVPRLSMIDLVCNCGPEAQRIIRP